MAMTVKLWGIRGSLPTPHTPQQIDEKLLFALEEFIRFQQGGGTSPQAFIESIPHFMRGGYGGHTACIQVTTPKANIIIDGGSGIRRLGEQLVLGPAGLGRGEIHILFTHFHWDHLVGLPFFIPIFIPGNKIHAYAVQDDLAENFKSMFMKPRFPVSFDDLAAKVSFHKLAPREPIEFGDLKVTPYQLDHPDPCWGYRFEHEGKVFSYCVDTECTRMSEKDLGPDLPLYRDVDLMIFDAQYTFIEASEKINWGHSSGPIGIDLALREKVKKVLFIHHDPAASDQKINMAEVQTREYYNSVIRAAKDRHGVVNEVDWSFAREGMVIEV